MTSIPPGQLRPPPRTLGDGRYRLLERLGRGGIATVWRALDTVLGIDRAVKLLNDDAGRSPIFRSRFLTEARLMARLEHPNVLRVYDYGSENGRYYLVMELVDGGSVTDLVRGSVHVEEPRALQICFDVLKALVAVHDTGTVHRDVKPGNILLAGDGSARLGDFGIAHITDQPLLHTVSESDSLGTVGYMAPEQRESSTRVDGRADLYSVGATLFAMLTRKHPAILDALEAHPEYLAHVSPPAAEVIRRATRQEPAERFADARTMALAVARAYDSAARGEIVQSLWLHDLDRSREKTRVHVQTMSSRPPPVRHMTPAGATPYPRPRRSPPGAAPPALVQTLTITFGILSTVIAIVVLAILILR